MHARLSILQLSAADEGGGAEDVAARLAAAYARSGHRSVLAVGRRRSGDGAVAPLHVARVVKRVIRDVGQDPLDIPMGREVSPHPV